MDIFGIGALAVCAAVIGALVKKSNREYAVLLAAGTAVLILLAALEQAGPLVSRIQDLSGAKAFHGEYLTVMLKAVGIAAAGQLAVHVCKDAGESALAYAVDLAAKTAILASALPLLLEIFDCLEEILRL